jgi:ribonuclease BN (tRNA processing enzyme)
VDLTVLGAGPAYTNVAGASGAAYLVRAGSTAVLLDLGQGSFTRLAASVEPSELTAVLVSHLHPDHFVDLVPLRHYLRFEFEPVRRVRVIGPPGLAGRLDSLNGQPGFSAGSLDVETIVPGEIPLGDVTVEARRVRHTADSHAFRLRRAGSDGPGLVYSGDCGEASDLEPLIRPGDSLLVEASFGTAEVPPGAQHLNAAAIADLAARTGPGRILLTHIQMGFDAAATSRVVAASFSGPVDVVQPGYRTTIA